MTTASDPALERRLRAVEDELAIIRLIASFGPLVDTGRTDLVTTLFAENGVYDVSYGRMSGAAFGALLTGAEHQDLVRRGVVHSIGLPFVRVNGDAATATNTTQLLVKDGENYRTFRIAQNVWKLVRTAEGWKILERMNRLIGDDDQARALLESAVMA